MAALGGAFEGAGVSATREKAKLSPARTQNAFEVNRSVMSMLILFLV